MVRWCSEILYMKHARVVGLEEVFVNQLIDLHSQPCQHGQTAKKVIVQLLEFVVSQLTVYKGNRDHLSMSQN